MHPHLLPAARTRTYSLYPHLFAAPGPALPDPQAVNKCFSVLGVATNSASEQRSAGRCLVSLCTHPDLRPAVDPLLVLRRLGRVVECTRAPAALGAALEALVAVADDAGWEDKVGLHAIHRACLKACLAAHCSQRRCGTPAPLGLHLTCAHP